jgi:hypothetical protein
MDSISEAQLSLIKRAAALTVEIEFLEGKLSMRKKVDLDLLIRAIGHLGRLLNILGLERKARDVTPSIEEYFETLHQREQQTRATAASAAPSAITELAVDAAGVGSAAEPVEGSSTLAQDRPQEDHEDDAAL